MKEYKRSNRVAELLREEVSKIVSNELKDPQINMATVSRIKLTDDLRHAKIYISVIGNKGQIKNSLNGLNRAKNHIRSELGKRINLRLMPELQFVYDSSAEYAQNIEDLLNQI